jgi:hypothetical protein
MPLSENQVAGALFSGKITVAGALQLFYDGEVLVYPALNIDYDTATWDAVENKGAHTSGIFHELRMAGADEADIKEVGIQIQRARDEGRVIKSKYEYEPDLVPPLPPESP